MVLALAGAWGIIQALADEGITQVVVPGSGSRDRRLAIVAGVVAALGPARRAARLDILRAVASE